MSGFDVFGMCVRNLLKRKLRTLLTMLGVIIGTAALVLTISLGLASDARFRQMADDLDMDMTLISVFPRGVMMWVDGAPVAPDGVAELNDDTMDIIAALPGVVVASPTMSETIFIRSGPYQMWARITGMRAEAIGMMFSLAEGRMIEPGEQNAAVFGALAEFAFERPGQDWSERRQFRHWMGEEITETYVDVLNDPVLFSTDMRFMWAGMEVEEIDDAMRPIPVFELNIVGVLEESTGQGWMGPNENIYMDIETIRYLSALRLESDREQNEEQGRFSGIEPTPRLAFETAIVRVDDPANTARVAEIIDNMGFHASYDGMWIDMMQEQQQGIQFLLIGVAAVSIFVAAISIANTMVMAVYERTREIGVMKVIGGAIKDIRRMFLLEAAFIGFLGGLFGVGLSLIASYILNNANLGILTDQFDTWWLEDAMIVRTSLITPWLCGVALVFASVVGLVSGYFPARRATKISALDAIRTD